MVMLHSCGRFAKCISVLKIGLLALFMLPPSLRAQQTIHVPADQPTIQAGINAASNGDTVLVSPGTYIENINFNGKAITVTSSGGPSATIIDGNANNAVVIFANSETANSVLNGFTIRNGLSQFSAPTQGSGGGIYITNASPTISGNVITNNQAVEGAGISVQFASPIIKGNTITLNHQCCGSGGTGGGGILIGGAGSAQILNNTITNNALSSAEGGGISLFAAGTPIIRGNLISGNSVSGLIPAATGGGIWIANQSDALILDNLIVGNSADQGAGISSNGSPNLLLLNNTIVYNNARLSVGSGVLAEGFTTLINNIIVGIINQSVVDCGQFSPNPPSVFQLNDVFSPQSNSLYGSCANETGKNGNLSSDPLFMSAANGDFHLRLGSSAIDAGDNTTPNLPTTDFDGNPRIVDGNNDGVAIVDLGAYEVGNTSAAAISPSRLVFSPQPVGVTSNPQPVTLNSTGVTAFQITSIQTSGDFTQTTTCPVITSPGSAPGVPNGSFCGFSVSFSPAANGPRAGLLTVTGTNGTSLQVSLSGTGFIPAPAAALSPASLSFSPRLVGTTSASQPVALTNTGNAGLNISSITASQPFAQTNNCPAVLPAATNCTINVTFQPIVNGNATGTLTIVDNASGSAHTVSLTGTGNPVPQPVAITLVQHASKDAGTTTSSSLAFPSNNTSGNWIAVAIRAGHSGQSFTVKDSKGNTYHQAIQFNVTTDAPNGDTLGIFYAEDIAGGANQVTVSDTISGTVRIAVLEYSGVASANSLDVTAVTQGSSSAPNSGSITTSANGDLLLGAVLTGNGENFTSGPGYLIEERVPAEPGTKLNVEDQVQSASGTVSAGVSLGAADSWGAAIVAFKSATTSVSTSPTITSLTPNSGGIGTSITITGTNFGSTQGTSTVTFNGTAATSTFWSGTGIDVPIPTGATAGNVVVTVGGVASNGVSFAPVPFIASLSPTSGPVGTLVTIAGTSFGAIQGTSTITFNGTMAVPVSWSTTSVTILVPPGASTGNVIATIAGVSSNGMAFTVLPTPNVTGLNPTSGRAGTSVTISGTNFGARQGISTVMFNGLVATPTSWSPTSISVTVPVTTTGNVIVTVGGVASNGVPFTIISTPNITSLNPTSGPVGTSVVIYGTNFGTTQGTVTFNRTAATPTSWSGGGIVAPVPAGATTGVVVVTVSGVATNGVNFTVTAADTTAPTAPTNLTASAGSGLSINLAWTASTDNVGVTNYLVEQCQGGGCANFTQNQPLPGNITPFVSIGPLAPATSYSFRMRAKDAAGNLSDYSNIASATTNSLGITRLNPFSGTVGTPVTIFGGGFGASQGTSTLTFNGTTGIPTSWSDASIIAPVPAGATTGNVVVTVGGVASNGAIFTVIPNISSLSPMSGPVGSTVTVTGSGFGFTPGTSTVAFNGISGALTSWSNTSITVLVPNGATTGNVVITVGGQSSNGVLFSVTPPTPNIVSLSANSGPVGTSVWIVGGNFGPVQGTSTVTFNGTAATPSDWIDTRIIVPVPSGATSGNIVVTVGGVASNGVAFTVNSAAPSITLVQHTSKDAGTTASSSLTFRVNNTAGNFIAVVIRAGKSGQVFSVSDSRGNVYKQAIQFNLTVDAETLGIFYAENIAGGANTITVSNTILGTMRFAVLEYSGVATSNSLDVSAVAEGTSASPAASTVTTNFSGDLLLGEIVTANPASFNSGSGYTIEERVPVEPNTKLIVEDQRQSIAGAASAGASLGVSDHWGAVVAAFRHP